MPNHRTSPYRTLWTSAQDDLLRAELGQPKKAIALIEQHGSVSAACRHLAVKVSTLGPERTGNAILKRFEHLGIVIPAGAWSRRGKGGRRGRTWSQAQIDILKEHWPRRPPRNASQFKLIAFYEALQAALEKHGLKRSNAAIKQQAARMGLGIAEQQAEEPAPQAPEAETLKANALTHQAPSAFEAQLTNRAIAILANGDRAKALLAFAQAGDVLGVIPEVTIKAFTEAFPGLQFHKAG